MGKNAVVLCSEGVMWSWQLRSAHRSPRYTMQRSDLRGVRRK
ncbi:DUF4113 domain-containing protein [Sulfitobacter sp. SK011]